MTLLAPIPFAVFVNGNFHSEVMAYDRAEALEIVFDSGVGCYISDMDAEPVVDYDWEPEEDYHPRSLYGN